MRIATLLFATLAVSSPIQAADSPPPVVAHAGSQIPAKGMQAISAPSEFDKAPKFISGLAPIYPITRLRLWEPGFADIVFVVDETGRTRDFQVLKTNYPYFASHAIAAIQKWRFEPATKHGHAVSCHVHIPFRYAIGR